MAIPIRLAPGGGQWSAMPTSRSKSRADSIKSNSTLLTNHQFVSSINNICLAESLQSKRSRGRDCNSYTKAIKFNQFSVYTTPNSTTTPIAYQPNSIIKLIILYVCLLNASRFIISIDCQSESQHQRTQNPEKLNHQSIKRAEKEAPRSHSMSHQFSAISHQQAPMANDLVVDEDSNLDFVPLARQTLVSSVIRSQLGDCLHNSENNKAPRQVQLKSGAISANQAEQANQNGNKKQQAASQVAQPVSLVKTHRHQRQFGRLISEPTTTTISASNLINSNSRMNQLEQDPQQAQDFTLTNHQNQNTINNQVISHPIASNNQNNNNNAEPPANNPNQMVMATTQSAKDSQTINNLPTPLNVVAPTTATSSDSLPAASTTNSSPDLTNAASALEPLANSSPPPSSSSFNNSTIDQNSRADVGKQVNLIPDQVNESMVGSDLVAQMQQMLANEMLAANHRHQQHHVNLDSNSQSISKLEQASATNRVGQIANQDVQSMNQDSAGSLLLINNISDNSAPSNSLSAYQPISSSPSSISVITPILGRPTSQQQLGHQLSQASSSTIIKPIYVLGTPIAERDYNHEASGSSNSLVGSATTQSASPNGPPAGTVMTQQNNRNRAPKITDSSTGNGSNSREQQQQQISGSQTIGEQTINDQFSGYTNPSGSGAKKQPSQLTAATSAAQNLPDSGSQQAVDQSNSMLDNNINNQLYSPSNNSQLSSLTTPAPVVNYLGDRMSGPSLIYTDGQLTHSDSLPGPNASGVSPPPSYNQMNNNSQAIMQQQLPATPRLFQSQAAYNSNQLLSSGASGVSAGSGVGSGAAVVGNNPRRPSLPPPVNQANAASGFRSPVSPSGPLLATSQQQQQQQMSTVSMSASQQQTTALIQPALNSISMLAQSAPSQSQLPSTLGTFYQTSLPPYLGVSNAPSMAMNVGGQQMYNNNNNQLYSASAPRHPYGNQQVHQQQQQQNQLQQQLQLQLQQQQAVAAATSAVSGPPISGSYSGRRPLNITRVEHISAECSNDLIRAVVVFNGTFKGIIYSSNYANDPTCLYINGTGSSRYEFSIRLNQCGTMNKMELHQPSTPGEARRRDQVMWNSLSIQYNPIIEQEWDEHFKVSCEYGSDFWKTVSFSPFNVVTNTGSPVVFTINPPQCQMDVLLGHGIGPKIAVDGPVTVGDPLTLLIHMKSEKAGYDILVKNCVAHNGGKQRMQLIDSNGCVVNERFISPFRGTYNDNDLRHVTLYAYLKAFRFTGSPVLYLECEIHMCQSACPPQMCYWRRLSKRSASDFEYEYTTNSSLADSEREIHAIQQPVISDSINLFKALQVRQEPEPGRDGRRALRQQMDVFARDDEAQLVCYRYAEVFIFLVTVGGLWLLICTVAIACCLRVRKITRSQFNHDRLAAAAVSSRHQHQHSSSSCLSPPSPGSTSLASGSISPSLISFATSTNSARKTLHSHLFPSHNHDARHHQSSFLWDSKLTNSNKLQHQHNLMNGRKLQGYC